MKSIVKKSAVYIVVCLIMSIFYTLVKSSFPLNLVDLSNFCSIVGIIFLILGLNRFIRSGFTPRIFYAKKIFAKRDRGTITKEEAKDQIREVLFLEKHRIFLLTAVILLVIAAILALL